MAGASLFGRDQLLAAFFIPDSFDPPVLWVALCTSVPAQGAGGSDLIEPEDPAYARGEYGVGSDFWQPTGRGGVTNVSGIYYPQLTEDYGEVLGWALCDDAYGGNAFVVGELATPERIFYDPDIIRVPVLGAGAIVVRQS
jgi:hypothetical protein